jgi:hypothetical protein
MQKVAVYQGIYNLTFHSDLLVYKAVTKPKPHNEVLVFSMAGYASDMKDFLRGNRKLIVDFTNPYGKTESFTIPDLDLYTIEQMKKDDFLKVVLTRNIDTIIKKEEEDDKQNPSFPLLFVTEENRSQQTTQVYNMVKNGITTPMFPNVDEHLILAGQLFIDKEDAKTVLEVLQGTSSAYVAPDILARGQFLMNNFQEWKDFTFLKMQEEKLIRKVQVRYSDSTVQIYEIVVNEEVIEKIVQDGVRDRKIKFTVDSKSFKSKVDGFNEYMTMFAPAMARRIDALAKPIHQPGDIRPETLIQFPKLLRQPLSAQRDAIEASLKALHLKRKVNVIGECGVGKTYIMAATNWIYNRQKNQTMKLLVFCPDTLVDTVWKEELEETLPDIIVHKIGSVNDLISYEARGFLDDKQDRAFILSQHAAKSGYSNRPAAPWVESKQAFVCPDCGKPVTELIKNEAALHPMSTAPKLIEQAVPFWFFNTQRHNNYKCKACESVLWEAHNKSCGSIAFLDGKDTVRQNHFVYSADLKGFYPRDIRPVKKHLEKLTKLHNDTDDRRTKFRLANEISDYRHLQMTIEGTEKEGRKAAVQKVSVAEYIFKKMRNRFTNLIIDEFHEFQGETDRADACVQLINSIPIIQTGTGTGMNGYAYSRFKTDYMLYPDKMKKYGYKIDDRDKYQATFGVTEKRFRLRKQDGATKKDTLAPIAKPGISPVIFPLFMQDTTVFISLSDLKENLPELKHYQIEVEMDPELAKAKEELEHEIRKVAKFDKKMFKSSIQVGYSFLDSPTVSKELKDRYTGDVLLRTPTVGMHSDNKLQELLKLAHNEIVREDRKMLIYTYYTNDGINQYLWDNLQKEGHRVTLLNKQDEESISCDGSRKKVQKVDREKYIREEVAKGTEILISNPELIKTGYNLIAFPTIAYYQLSYQVYTNRQADRRAWRLGQTKDCKIIYIYYKESIQQDIASLMATKIVASQAIEGNMDAAGLEAICSDRTAEEELAKKFFEGIRGKVVLREYKEAV